MSNRAPRPKLAATAMVLMTVSLSGSLNHARFDSTGSTSSRPLALSVDNKLVWSVNPDDDSVSVIRTDANEVVTTITVGDEPQSVALTSDNRYAYVANAAAGTITVIEIENANPDAFSARAVRTVFTGAEPWNVVASPDAKRVFVANGGQDTITVINVTDGSVVGHLDLRDSLCNDPDRNRHFQPRGLAVTADSTRLYVTRFFSFVRTGGVQATDEGRTGLVCQLRIDTSSDRMEDYSPVRAIDLPPQETGFNVDSTGDGIPDATSAFPNQLQSIVIHGDAAYLPNIAASPAGPLRFDVSPQSFVNVVGGVDGDAARHAGAINLNLGARIPEADKQRLFFANPWAIAFADRGGTMAAYVVSAGSDVLVKVNVTEDGMLSNTVDADTTRYIDLNDPANPITSGDGAGKNPRGIVITDDGRRAYVTNFVSRSVSVVDLERDTVIEVVRTTPLPIPGSREEELQVGAEVFYGSRGHFNRPGSTGATDNRLSMEGWQSCASCHVQGLHDGVVWSFPSGPRKTLAMNGSFDPRDPENGQRVFNFGATFDEIEDFDAVVRDVQGPGLMPLAAPIPCSEPPPETSRIDPDHGLLVGDDGSVATPPCDINPFAKANTNRSEVTVTLPGSSKAIPALTALKTWLQSAVRSPKAPLTGDKVPGGVAQADIEQGRRLFAQAGCITCHAGPQWTVGIKDFVSPASDAVEGYTRTERTGEFSGNPVGTEYLNRFLRDIGSFNIGVAGRGNPLGANIGAPDKTASPLVDEVAQPPRDALGTDYNGDGRGIGFNVPSLLGIYGLPPYLHNGACETLACVVSDRKHRTANGTLPDVLSDPERQSLVVRFLESITDETEPFPIR
jgi:YVTN family beta-propeller protein